MPTIAPERQADRNRTLQRQDLDSIGLGKVTEPQLRAVVELIKQRGLLNEPPPNAGGRGIVIAGGGKYLDYAWVNASWLRLQAIDLPIQVWFLGPAEMPEWARPHFEKLDVELIDAFEVRQKHYHRALHGWNLKHYAAMRTRYKEVVLYDADCFALAHPEEVFHSTEFQQNGAVFFRDINKCRTSDWAFYHGKIRVPDSELDSGFFFWDRVKAWEGIKMTTWMGEQSQAWDKCIFGDKDRPLIGFGTTGTPYHVAPLLEWAGWGIRHYWHDKPIAAHAMAFKRKEANAPDPMIVELFKEWATLSRA